MTQLTLPFPPQSYSRISRLIGYMLRCANASPPYNQRNEFYAMKDRICRRFGKLVGEDLQHIIKHCYTCEDTPGKYGTQSCHRCDGTGIFDEAFYILERWDVGGYIFHRPKSRYSCVPPEGMSVTIKGHIRHDRVGRFVHLECQILLALIFDRRLAYTLLFNNPSYQFGWTICPMSNISRLAWIIRQFAGRFVRHECYCGRTYRKWFDRANWLVCRKCRAKSYQDIDIQIPF
jgi:hypothetical protein